jgi:hypothetical protein
MTPLHWSSRFGHLETCRLLVDSRADVTARTMCRSPSRASQSFSHSLRCSCGTTPLKLAIVHNKADVVAYLRGIGAPE